MQCYILCLMQERGQLAVTMGLSIHHVPGYPSTDVYTFSRACALQQVTAAQSSVSQIKSTVLGIGNGQEQDLGPRSKRCEVILHFGSDLVFGLVWNLRMSRASPILRPIHPSIHLESLIECPGTCMHAVKYASQPQFQGS